MPNISEYPRPILTYFTGLLGVLVGMIFQVFLWRSPKGCCYGNQLNMGDVRKRRVEPPSLFASAFENGLADRKSIKEKAYRTYSITQAGRPNVPSHINNPIMHTNLID